MGMQRHAHSVRSSLQQKLQSSHPVQKPWNGEVHFAPQMKGSSLRGVSKVRFKSSAVVRVLSGRAPSEVCDS